MRGLITVGFVRLHPARCPICMCVDRSTVCPVDGGGGGGGGGVVCVLSLGGGCWLLAVGTVARSECTSS